MLLPGRIILAELIAVILRFPEKERHRSNPASCALSSLALLRRLASLQGCKLLLDLLCLRFLAVLVLLSHLTHGANLLHCIIPDIIAQLYRSRKSGFKQALNKQAATFAVHSFCVVKYYGVCTAGIRAAKRFG